MSLSVINENQNSLSITNEAKTGAVITWDDMDIPWNDAAGTWDEPGTPFVQEAQNALTITNENQN